MVEWRLQIKIRPLLIRAKGIFVCFCLQANLKRYHFTEEKRLLIMYQNSSGYVNEGKIKRSCLKRYQVSKDMR